MTKQLNLTNEMSLIRNDDVLLLSASWEKRCTGLTRYIDNYRSKYILMTVYDGVNETRLKNIELLERSLLGRGEIIKVPALHENPLLNVLTTLEFLSQLDIRNPKISIDISCFTRIHLLQLLQGLEINNSLRDVNFYYTESSDYFTHDNEHYCYGISSVKVINTFAGYNFPSKDRILIIFLGYEGYRALSLWEHLTHNITLAIVPHPPYHANWVNRTEAQNSYLLSTLPKDQIYHVHSLKPESTELFLDKLIHHDRYGSDKYNFFIAPLGTKAQTLGLFRFYIKNKNLFSIVYANPFKYKYERAIFDPGRSWLLDSSKNWSSEE